MEANSSLSQPSNVKLGGQMADSLKESADSTVNVNVKPSSSRVQNRHHRSSSSHHHRHHFSSTSTTPSSASIIRANTGWFQRKINLRPAHRGCHLVTDEVLKQIPEISHFQVGVCNLHIMHTSASLTLNENWDPDVREDMELFLTNFIPENLQFRHGPHEDMPAHVKSCFLGSSLTIPITEGKLSLGVWQGIWLCEHRDNAGSRKLMVTINGALKS